MPRIHVNGEPRDLTPGQTLADLLRTLGIEAHRVVVERNREIHGAADFAGIVLENGDELEILHFMGGG